MTALITGAVTLLTGSLLYYIQSISPKLVYSVIDTLPFESPNENMAIYHVEIRNDGKSAVRNVVCQVSVSPAVMKTHRVKADPALRYTESMIKDQYRIELSDLAKNESVSLSFLASSETNLATRPTVSLRAEGIKGEEAKKGSPDIKDILLMIGAVTTGFGAFIGMLFSKNRLFGLTAKSMEEDVLEHDKSIHSGDQSKIIAYLFGLRGMTKEANVYLSRSEKCEYWSESDIIASVAVTTSNSDEVQKRKGILIDMLRYASIAKSSTGIIHYNIARIAKYQGNREESESHLSKACEVIPKLISTRLNIDPIFL